MLSSRELLDPSAVDADDVVVVLAFVQLEDGRAALEVMAGDEPGRLELREHAVDRREADVLVRIEQAAVDVLGTHVARLARRSRISRIFRRGTVIFSPARRSCEGSTMFSRPAAAARKARFLYHPRPLCPARAGNSRHLNTPEDRMALHRIVLALALLAAADAARRMRLPAEHPAGQPAERRGSGQGDGRHDAQPGALTCSARRWSRIRSRRNAGTTCIACCTAAPRRMDSAHFIVFFEGDKVVASRRSTTCADAVPQQTKLSSRPPADTAAGSRGRASHTRTRHLMHRAPRRRSILRAGPRPPPTALCWQPCGARRADRLSGR